MKLVFVAVALVAGAGLACQVGFNTQLRVRFGHPIPAALTNFAVGLACLLTIGLATSTAWPKDGFEAVKAAPWWAWMGGVVGSGYILTSAAFAKRLGATGWLGAIVAGQILASLAIDHFGLVGFRAHPLSTFRVLGAVLLVVGLALVLRN